MAGLKKNKDLDLRRYGKNLYTKALQSGGNGSSEGSGGIADWDGVYQFYKQQLLSAFPPDVIEAFIIPEHFEDIVDVEGTEYETGTMGIWSTDRSDITAGDVLFTVQSNDEMTFIVFTEYYNAASNDPSIG